MLSEAPGDLRTEAERLDAEFDGWHVWLSAAGRFWATRLGRIKPSHTRSAKWFMTVDADTPDQLRQQLRKQNKIPDH